jgi:DNA-binding response OmpR family regulator
MDKPSCILIVDDEPHVRLGFRTTLETVGYAVEEAADGETALARLEQPPSLNLVLLDLLMPGPDGLEVLSRLRDAGNGVPVVIVTAHGTIPDAVKAIKLGAIDFLSKPLTPTDLRRTVGEVLARHAGPGPAPERRPDEHSPAAHQQAVTLGPVLLELTQAKLALNRREFDRAAELLEQALDLVPDSAEALTLTGILRESRGQDHAAYQSYKSALEADPGYAPARDNMRRYCERFNLEYQNPTINPGARAASKPARSERPPSARES